MRTSTWIVLMLSITLAGYWLGIPSAADGLTKRQAGAMAPALGEKGYTVAPACNNLLDIACYSNESVIGIMIMWTIISAGALLISLTNFSPIYILPIFIFMALLQFFVLPTWIFLDNSLPAEIRVPLMAIYNISMVLAITSFIRGGE
jgi:hypothetical protein